MGEEHQLFEPVENIAQSPDDEKAILKGQLLRASFGASARRAVVFSRKKIQGGFLLYFLPPKSRKYINRSRFTNGVRIPAMLTPSFRMKLTPIFRQADPLKRREPGEGDSDKLTPSDLIQYSGMLTPKGLFLGD